MSRLDPRASLIAIAGVAVLLVVGGQASAHASHLDVDPQASGQPEILAEGVFSSSDGWLVVHEVNETGEPTQPRGHISVDADTGFRTEVPVPIDDEFWANLTSPTELALAMHENEGSSSFDPDEDPILEAIGGPVVERFTLAKAQTRVYVGALEFGPQAVENGTLTVRSVQLAESAHLVLRLAEEGEAIGDRLLQAGTHRNVTVDLAPSARLEGTTRLQVQLYQADDESFDGDEELVSAGSAPIASEMSAKPAESNQTKAANATNGTVADNATDARQPAPLSVATTLLAVPATAIAIAVARKR